MEQEQIKFTIPRTYSNLKELHIVQDAEYLGAHFHTAIEVVFVKTGSVLCCFEENFVRIPENHVFIIGSNVIHCLKYDNAPAELCYLQIDITKIIGIIYPELASIPLIPDNNLKKYALFSSSSPVYKLIKGVLCELKMKKEHFETAAIGELIQLTAYLQREFLVPDFEGFFKNPSLTKILPVILYANEHYPEKIYLDNVCKILHMDKYYLCKLFKKSTGITFFQYLSRVRLHNAEKLLITTNKSVTQIALECGFSTIQYFNSVFVKAKGYSPSLYRKLY